MKHLQNVLFNTERDKTTTINHFLNGEKINVLICRLFKIWKKTALFKMPDCCTLLKSALEIIWKVNNLINRNTPITTGEDAENINLTR